MKNRFLALHIWALTALFSFLFTISHAQQTRLVDLLQVRACSKYQYSIYNPTTATLTVQVDPGNEAPLIQQVLSPGRSMFVTQKVSWDASVSAHYSAGHYQMELQNCEQAIERVLKGLERAILVMIGVDIWNKDRPNSELVARWEYGDIRIYEKSIEFEKEITSWAIQFGIEMMKAEAQKQILALSSKAAQIGDLYSLSNSSSSVVRPIYDEVKRGNNRLFNPGFMYDFAFYGIVPKPGLNETWNNRRGTKMTVSFGLPGEIQWGRKSAVFTRFYIEGVFETLKFRLRETGEFHLNADLLEGTNQGDVVHLPVAEKIHLRGRRFGAGAKMRTQIGRSIYASISGGMLYSIKAKLVFDKETEYFKSGNIQLKDKKVGEFATLTPKSNPYLASEIGFLSNRAEGCRYYVQAISFFIGGQISRGQFEMDGEPKLFQSVNNKIEPVSFESKSKWMYNVWVGIGAHF